ncbi:MAG: leucine-rich repeat protein [Eubacterium sp.]|nr:leucine-rich repeat protein [Eubacterium sp.]
MLWNKKSIMWLCILAIFVLCVIPSKIVNADEIKYNPDSITLYYLRDVDKEQVGDIPADYPTQYQIEVGDLPGTPRYGVIKGGAVTVSKSGLITVSSTNEGKAVVRVVCDDYVQDINVEVVDYRKPYVDKMYDDIISEIISADMTEYEKLDAICKWIANNTDYGTNPSHIHLMIMGSGSCVASTNAILRMCQKAGIHAEGRSAVCDPGQLGTDHVNVIALCDGEYYMADAGYVGKHPRGYSIDKKPGGFFLNYNKNATLYQYDGFESDLVIPESIGEQSITVLGTMFASGKTLNSIYLPSTINEVQEDAFKKITGLKKIDVSPDNQYYESDGIALYTKGKNKLLYVGREVSDFSIDSNATEIDANALSLRRFNNLSIPGSIETLNEDDLYSVTAEKLTLKEGVKTIKENAFRDACIYKLELPSTLTTIEQYAFKNAMLFDVRLPEGFKNISANAFASCSFLDAISIPSSVETIGENAFGDNERLVIYYAGTQEQWDELAKDLNLSDGVRVVTDSVRVTGIETEQNDLKLYNKGDTISLDAIVYPENASNKKVEYETGNYRVVDVTDNVVIAVGDGETTVKATTEDGSFVAYYNVVVSFKDYQLSVEGGIIDGNEQGVLEKTLKKGDKVSLELDYDAEHEEGTRFDHWAFEPEFDGCQELNVGSDEITFYMPAQDVKVTAVYVPIPVTRVFINNKVSGLCVDEEYTSEITVYPERAKDKSVTWSSSDESVLTVDSNGMLKGVSPGSARITIASVSNPDVQAYFDVTVYDHTLYRQILEDPTCEKAGKARYTCAYCDYIREESIPAKGHDYIIQRVISEPTDESDGTAVYICQNCNGTKEDSITAEEYARYKYEYGQDDYYDDDNNEDYNNSNNDDNNSNTNSNTNYDYNDKNNNDRDSYNGNNSEGQDGKGKPDRNTSYSNEWRDGRWYNADGTQTYSGTLQWKSNATGWWVEDTDGWYPTDSWQKIDNVWYYFKPDGYMASNEYYNGYWFNADGSWDDKYLLSWKSNSTGWWVEDISGWWPSSSWLKIDGYWYYFDASGYMVSNCYIDGWWISADGVCY